MKPTVVSSRTSILRLTTAFAVTGVDKWGRTSTLRSQCRISLSCICENASSEKSSQRKAKGTTQLHSQSFAQKCYSKSRKRRNFRTSTYFMPFSSTSSSYTQFHMFRYFFNVSSTIFSDDRYHVQWPRT